MGKSDHFHERFDVRNQMKYMNDIEYSLQNYKKLFVFQKLPLKLRHIYPIYVYIYILFIYIYIHTC